MTLPAREEVEFAPTIEVDGWTQVDIERVCEVVEAYADGELMSRAEWEATSKTTMSEPTLYQPGCAHTLPPNCTICNAWAVLVEPEHQHQWLPWLTLPNGSSWTQCTGCEEQFQYDH